MNQEEKSDRLVEAATAILDAAPRHQLNVVVLNKALFYLDLASLRDRGETVTNNAYIAIQQGPVVAKYQQRLIGQLELRGFAEQLNDEWDGSKPLRLTTSPGQLRFLDEEAKNLASKVTSHFAEMSSGEASRYSHDNLAWSMAWNEYRRTGRPKPVDLQIAMQQIIEDDPWMDLPMIDEEEIFAAADAGEGIDW